MKYTKHYALLRCNDENTGDSFSSFSRLEAAQYFATKKQISLKEWLVIYKINKK